MRDYMLQPPLRLPARPRRRAEELADVVHPRPRAPRGVRSVVHPPLDAPAKKKEGETMEATKAAVLSALPLSMQPLVPDTAPRA